MEAETNEELIASAGMLLEGLGPRFFEALMATLHRAVEAATSRYGDQFDARLAVVLVPAMFEASILATRRLGPDDTVPLEEYRSAVHRLAKLLDDCQDEPTGD